MDQRKMNDTGVKGVLVFVTLLFGINPIVVKVGITEMSPMIFTTGRLFVAVIAFGVVMLLSRRWVRPEKGDFAAFIIIGIEAFLFQIGMILALQFVSAAIVATMLGLIPVSILVINSLKGRHRIVRKHYIGAMITFIGIIFISGIISSVTEVELWRGIAGIGILMIAQFSAAAYMVRSEGLLVKYSHYQVTALMFFVTFLLFLVGSLPVVVRAGIEPVSSLAINCMIYGGLVSLCLANILWTWGIKEVGSHQAAIFNNLPPVFAVVAGILFLNEIPRASQVIGVVLILFGLFIFNLQIKSKAFEV